MAAFEKKKHAQDEFNKGNKYVANDGVQPATINNLVENSLYTEAFAESLASTPDTTNVAQTGIPSVELVDNPSTGITGAKKFKFSNLKGEQGHSYFRASTSLATTATSVSSSFIQWGASSEALISDSIVDNNGNVFAVTARTAATSPTIPISYRTSIRGTAGADGTDGEDGASVFIRYSASSNGSNMTAAPAENTRYIGFYLGQSASNTASDYTWSQYVGKEISEVTIDEFSFVITYDDGTKSTAPLNTENCLVTYAVPSGEATAMTAYLVPSNADLNDYRGENYWGKTFYAGGSNTVQNTPIAGIAFNLEVLRSGAFATVQRITMMAAGSNNQPTVYTRSVSDTTTTGGEGSWTAWTEVAESNGTYPDMTVGKATNATNDGGGNNIASTYATQSALSSGLAGKANTSGTYSNLTVGKATNATNDGGGNNIANTYATKAALAEISAQESVLPVKIDLREYSGNNITFYFAGVGFVPSSVKDSLKVSTPASKEDVAAAMFSAFGSMSVISVYGVGLKAGAPDSVFSSLNLLATSATHLSVTASGFRAASDTNLTGDTQILESVTFTSFRVGFS